MTGKPRHADFGEQVETARHDRGAEEMRRAVLEPARRGKQRMQIVLDGHVLYGTTGKPWTREPREGVAPGDERANAGRIAEQLVERERDEAGR